ncbi:hypothetical protein BESB_004720 [Besnoitia besnoiti]|uniref:Uncharacterized protein n=1 Tax=Besnoitia besnoiti TaxID=94643 RepID=A0A2A9MNK0_BESBE|nr:hypothetical protein BESB_004720 [Besnoitia besnoiti]PFH38131.1 hypothetical protein BESB_004720 [Besnoitia besnoiti]
MSCYRHVWRSAPAVALSDVQRWGRRNNVHKLTLLVQTYEKPCVKRTRIAEEKAYYPRWFYLRYCAEVIKYSLKHHLRLGAPLDPKDDQRLDCIQPLQMPTAEERRSELARLEEELTSLHKQILEMDAFSVITGAKKSLATSDPLHVTAADILEEVERRQGRLLSLSAFVRRYYRPQSAASRSWTLSELRVLHLRLERLVVLVLEVQSLRDLLALEDGKCAKWGKGLKEEELVKLFDTKRIDLTSP